MTDLDPPDVRRRLDEDDRAVRHHRISYAPTRLGALVVLPTVAALLSAVAGWSLVASFVAPQAPVLAAAGAGGGGLVGLALAAGVLVVVRRRTDD